MNHRAVLLVNLGSPDSVAVKDVRTYLGEFLMDGRVLDAFYPVRWCIVHLGILPKRPAQSAEAYEKIWTPEGSPLVVTSQKVRDRLRTLTGATVELAMRYRHPSIPEAVRKLREAGVNEVLLIPLFPHYAMSSYETAVVRVKEVIADIAPGMSLQVVAPYYDHPDYIRAMVANAAQDLQEDYDHLLFSFHGIPERHLRKADPSGRHPLPAGNCCENDSPALPTCYRAQCFRTAEAFCRAASIPQAKYSIAFQSRLGREPWLAPYTDHVLEQLAKSGRKKLVVICPSFVSDCLETLEEIGMRGREIFLEAGGTDFRLVPCLNEHPLWLHFLEKLTREFCAAPMPGAAIRPTRAGRELRLV
ncbi:MAG TPA: ferrochelatase [Verrucomicrobiae bacterium]|jgi:ferrochelatase|nr:ferrochelatase [Verrucomicrobiae bacterium]